jgi:hypothetical protein
MTYPLVCKILEEPRERQGGAVDAPLADKPVQARLARDQLQLELLPVGLVEMGDSYAVDGLLHGGISAQPGRGTQTRSWVLVVCFAVRHRTRTLTWRKTEMKVIINLHREELP